MKLSLVPFLCLILFLFPLASGVGQSISPDTNIISGIKIYGLKRTKQRTAEEPLKRFLGMDAEKVDFDDVRAAVLGLGILEPVEVGIEDNQDETGKILWVTVHEKWSIFPLPLFFINSDGYKVGAMFLDSNAFGLNDKFALAGMYGSVGWMAAVAYFHQGRKGVPGWNVAAFYSHGDQEYRNQENDGIRKFQADSLSFMGGIRYAFNELFSADTGVSFYMGEISTTSSSYAVPGDDGYYINPKIGLDLSKDNWDGYFLSRKSLAGSFTYSYGLDGPSFYTFRFQGVLEQSIIPGLKGWVRSSIIYAPDVPPFFESQPSEAGIDILPSSFFAKNYFGGTAGLEKSLYKFSFGTLSLFGSYQMVYSDGPIIGGSLDYGIAGGIRLYMSKLAIPALGVGVTYNFAASYFQGYFSFGIGF